MEIPKSLKDADQREAVVRQVEDDDSTIVVDFGTTDELTVDVVGETAIVVFGDEQFEFELPAGATDVSVNNGILTITE